MEQSNCEFVPFGEVQCEVCWFLHIHLPIPAWEQSASKERHDSSLFKVQVIFLHLILLLLYQDADKSLAQPGRKQAQKHARDARDFNKIETRAVIKFLFLQGKALKEIHAILTEKIACFLPGRAKDLSAPQEIKVELEKVQIFGWLKYWTSFINPLPQ